VKSDEHMAKVKEQLMFEQRAIEQAEERWVDSAAGVYAIEA
jgi:rRNA-processing protein EBP2